MATFTINGNGGGSSFELVRPDVTNNYAPNYEAKSVGNMVSINHKYEIVSNIAGPAHYSEFEVNGTTYGSAKELVSTLNGIINFNSGGSGGGSLVVADDHFFATTAERDAYFASNPSELVKDVLAVTGTNPATLWRYDGTNWEDITAVIRGPQGEAGKDGLDGKSEAAEYTQDDVYSVRQLVVSGDTLYWVLNNFTASGDIEQDIADGHLKVVGGIIGSEIGSLTEHTNINSLDAPTITIPSETEPSETITKIIATVDQIPIVPEPLIYRINEMFDFPSDAEFVAELHKAPIGSNDRDFIVIRAQDITGITNDLVITAELGFGSFARKLHAGWTVNDGSSDFTPYTIEITPEIEDDSTKTQIRIPAECNSVNIFYMVGNLELNSTSYWVDKQGVYHPFSLSNTPIENLCLIDVINNTFILNGITVYNTNIDKIVLGLDYTEFTGDIPNFFLFGMTTVREISLLGLKNISSFGSAGLQNCGIYGKDFTLSLPIFSKNVFFADSLGRTILWESNIIRYDLRAFENITELPKDIGASTRFPPIDIQIGSIDFSSKSVPVEFFIGSDNKSTSILRADTQALADAFKAKVPTTSNFTVILNS